MLSQAVRKFSTSARCLDKLYELRIYSIKSRNMKATMERSTIAMPIRFKHSPALGYFYSELGGPVGEAIHIWEYESYGQRAGVRKSLAADPDWISLASPMISNFDKQENLTMRLFPWSKIQTEVKPGGVFFLYKFTFTTQSATPETISSALKEFLGESKLNALGVWKEELGSNSQRNAYAVFHADSFDSDQNPVLASQQAWANLSKHTSEVHGRLLTAAPWSSPWK